MSWLDRVKTGYTIKMGDGATYTPKWFNPTVAQDFNISMYEYPNIAGTDVDRRNVKGSKYSIELYFDGENHIDVSTAFRNSAKNSKPWTITHPYYDTLVVHPISLNYDNSVRNVTKITGTVIETITRRPQNRQSAKERILLDKVAISELQVSGYGFKVTPTTADIRAYKGDLDTLYAQGSKNIPDAFTANNYFTLYNQAYAKLDSLISAPLTAIRQAQAFIEAPYLFFSKVTQRIQLFADQIDLLRATIDTLWNGNRKRQYETNVGFIIGGMAAATVTNTDGSYQNRAEVIQVADQLRAAFNQYIIDLDSLQSATGMDDDAYIPDFDGVNSLRNQVIYTINNLLEISATGRIEMSVKLEYESDAMNLVHEFYGADPQDIFLNEFITINSFGLSDLLIIPAGKTVVYYMEDGS